MADLKIGTTIGGSTVWGQGNLPLNPSGNSLLYKTFKVYTENDKPTPAEINAYTKTETYSRSEVEQLGQVRIKDVRDFARTPEYFAENMMSPWFNQKGVPTEDVWYSGLTMKGWGSTYATWQLASKSANGSSDNKLWVRTSQNPTTWNSWGRVYTSLDKPTPDDIGAVSKSLLPAGGSYDQVTGKLARISTDGVMEVARYIDFHTNGSTVDYDIRLDCKDANTLNITGGKVQIEGQDVYHKGARPTPADIGAVNKAGDTMTGDLTITKSGGQIKFTPTINDSNPGFYFSNPANQNLTVKHVISDGQLPQAGQALVFTSSDASQLNHLVTDGEFFARNNQKVYHTGNKPNKTDVGLSNVNNWAATTAVNDSSTTKYATASAVKQAYDLANSKLASAGGTLTGGLTVNGVFNAGSDLSVNLQHQNKRIIFRAGGITDTKPGLILLAYKADTTKQNPSGFTGRIMIDRGLSSEYLITNVIDVMVRTAHDSSFARILYQTSNQSAVGKLVNVTHNGKEYIALHIGATSARTIDMDGIYAGFKPIVISDATSYTVTDLDSDPYLLNRYGNRLVNVTGTGSDEGIRFNSKTAIGGVNDSWLRLNPAGQFAGGVYTGPTGQFRHDGSAIYLKDFTGTNLSAAIRVPFDGGWSSNGSAAFSSRVADSGGANWLIANYYDADNIRSGIQVLSTATGNMRFYTNRRSNYAEIANGNVYAGSAQSTATNALTRKDYVDGQVSTRLALTGGTLTGTLTTKNISVAVGNKIYLPTADSNIIQIYSRPSGDTFGGNLYITSGGNTVVGAGESATNLETLTSGENLFLTADGEIQLISGANTWADRKTTRIDSNGRIISPGGVTASGNGAQIDIVETDQADKTWRLEIADKNFKITEVGVKTWLSFAEGGQATFSNVPQVATTSYPSLKLYASGNADTVKSKYIEMSPSGDLNIITRNTAGANNGIITIPKGETGTVYHTGRKPTPGDVGAVNKAGDTMTGKLTMSATVSIAGGDVPERQFEATSGTNKAVFRVSAGDTLIGTQVNGAWKGYLKIGPNDGLKYYDIGGAARNVYHTGYKPTAADVGAYAKADVYTKDETDSRLVSKTIGNSKALSSEDLDTLKTAGVFHQSANANATTARHYPEQLAGSLIVYIAAGIIQEYRIYNSSRLWTRAQYSTGAWTPWVKKYDTANNPTPADIGAVATSLVNTGQAGSWAGTINKIPYIGSNGAMEIAKYIDMHDTNSTLDYNVRLNAESSNLAITTPNGTIQIGAMNASYAHIYTDRPSFYMNTFLSAPLFQARTAGIGFQNTVTVSGDSSAVVRGAVQGGAWTTWQARAPGLLVDCQDSTNSAHAIWKATHWGVKHLACMDVHSPATGPIVALHVGTRNNAFSWDESGRFNAAGIIWSGSNGDFNDVYIRSDIRLKSDLVKVDNAINKVLQLTGYSYDKHKSLTDKEIIKREVGLIAQDVQKVLPEAVNESEDTTLTISNSSVNALLVEAIKEQQKQIEAMMARIKQLEKGA